MKSFNAGGSQLSLHSKLVNLEFHATFIPVLPQYLASSYTLTDLVARYIVCTVVVLCYGKETNMSCSLKIE